jgi:hypothetical protein
MTNLVQYQNDIIIDESTKEAYTSIMGAARICFGEERHIAEEYKIRRFISSAGIELEEVQILNRRGFESTARRIPEDLLMELIAKYNPSLLPQLAKAGLRAYLYHLAGYQIIATPPKPQDPLELIIAMAQEQLKEKQRLSALEAKVNSLMPSEQFLTIVRYSNRFGKVDGNFGAHGRKLTKLSTELGYDIQQVPDPKYGHCNAYHIDVLKLYFEDKVNQYT